MNAQGPNANENDDFAWCVKTDRVFFDFNMKYLLHHFKGRESIFTLRSHLARRRVQPSMFRFEKAIMHLRLQYLHSFILHFVSERRFEYCRNSDLFLEFKKQIIEFRRQIEETYEPDLNFNKIMAWEKSPDGGNITSVKHAIEHLAKRHKVSTDEVAKFFGPFPTMRPLGVSADL